MPTFNFKITKLLVWNTCGYNVVIKVCVHRPPIVRSSETDFRVVCVVSYTRANGRMHQAVGNADEIHRRGKWCG